MFHQSCIKLIDPLQIFDTVLFSNHCAVWEETVRGVGASGEDGGLWPDSAPVSRQLPRLDQVHGSPSGVLRDRESSGRGREGTQDHFIQVTTKLFDDERVMRFTATIYFCLYIILYRNLIGIIYFWYIKRYVGVIKNKKLYAFFWWKGWFYWYIVIEQQIFIPHKYMYFWLKEHLKVTRYTIYAL